MKSVRSVNAVIVPLFLVSAVLLSAHVSADLTLTISQDASDATMTRWQFNGSTTLAENSPGANSGVGSSNWDTNPHTSVNLYFLDHTYSAATITAAGITSPVATPQIGFASGGLFLVEQAMPPFVGIQGDLIEWSGDLRIDTNIADFNPGTHTSMEILGGEITDPLKVVVIPSVIPEPSSFGLLFGVGVLIATGYRRKG